MDGRLLVLMLSSVQAVLPAVENGSPKTANSAMSAQLKV
jgi:hypothetical protein